MYAMYAYMHILHIIAYVTFICNLALTGHILHLYNERSPDQHLPTREEGHLFV
jgi:hypothetical protein